MAKNEVDIGKLIYDETEKRLGEMGQPGYPFPDRATKKDAIGIIAAIIVCIGLIAACMAGVIQ